MRVARADYVTRLGGQTYCSMGHPIYLGNKLCKIDYEENSYSTDS